MNKDVKVALIGLTGKSIFMNVDEFHKPGETIIAKSVHVEPGGKGYNQAACLLKLGANVSYLTTVGEDDYADTCYEYLNQTNANLYFKQISEESTAIATILTNKYGDNQVTVFQGASSKLNLNHLDDFLSVIKKSDILLLTLELPLEIIEVAIKTAWENDVFTILNPAPFNPKFTRYDLCDVIIPNEIEARQLFKLQKSNNIVDEVRNVSKSIYFRDNFKNVIITLGSDGCLFVNKDETIKFNGIYMNTVDTTGAGDVFNASFAYFYGIFYDFIKAIELANISAAISTTKKYVLNSLPSMEEIISYKKL